MVGKENSESAEGCSKVVVFVERMGSVRLAHIEVLWMSLR